jgi:hypothetical protein
MKIELKEGKRAGGLSFHTYTRQSPSTFRSGMKNTTHAPVRIDSGKFKRKIQRHELAERDASAAPIMGPMPFASATTAP